MHALVTGGAGFIGSHLAKKLIDEGAIVTVIDNLSTGYECNIPSNCDFINLDLTDSDFLKKMPESISHVFHLAAQSSGEISYENPSYDLKINAMSTLELLKWSLEQKVEKFLYTSSMNVYGNVEDKPITEQQIVAPESFYAVGKVASENYLKIFFDIGLNTTVLRLFNVYGPGQNLENLKQGMLSIYIAYILKNEPIIVKGSLNRFRDFVYIDDVISSILSAINYNSQFDIFNICTGIRTTVNEALDSILKVFKKKDYRIYENDGTPRDQFGIYGDNRKAKSLLNWQNKTSLEKGLTQIFEALKERS
jgi:UDP-glucose 4-epimerase